MNHYQETHVHPARKASSKILIAIAGLGGTILVLEAIMHLASIRAGLSLQVLPADHMSREYIENLTPALAHLIPGIAFLILGALQFSSRIRRRWPIYHRVAGLVFILCTVSVGISGVWMNEILPGRGGVLKYVGSLVFGIAATVTVGLGMAAIARGDLGRHRAWMMRTYGIGLAGGVQRLIGIPLFLTLGDIDDLTIGAIMWLGWLLTVGVVEWRVWRSPSARLDVPGRHATFPSPVHGDPDSGVSA